MVVVPLGTEIDDKDVHPSKAPAPIEVKEDGMLTDCNDVQSENACCPICVTVLGICTERSVSFCANAPEPIAVTVCPSTVDGMDILLSLPE